MASADQVKDFGIVFLLLCVFSVGSVDQSESNSAVYGRGRSLPPVRHQ